MTATPTVVRYEPRGAVLEAFRYRGTELLLSGAAGTGKSVGALMKIHLASLTTGKVRSLIVRKTQTSLTSSTLVTFREKVAAEALEAGLMHFYGGSAQEPASYRYSNGSVVVVGGLDRPTRLLSTEYDLIFVDEAIEVTAEDLDTLVTRLRNGRLSYQQLLLATNPGPPSHHLKRRADAGRTKMLYSQHEDNPRMFDGGEWTEYGRTYLARLDSLTGVRLQRMRRGLWVASEGLVYEDWDEAIHLVDRVTLPAEWTRWWSVDFGYVHPFVGQCWVEDPDGRLWLEWEVYHTHRTSDEHAVTMLNQISRVDPDYVHPPGRPQYAHHGRIYTGPKPREIICDHNAEGRALLERELGRSTVPAKKAVIDGIQAVQGRLRTAGDGKPRLFVMRDAVVEKDPQLVEAKAPTCTLDEVVGYVWDTGNGKNPKENPVKEQDDGMDALRYVVMRLDRGGRPGIRSLT